MTDDPINMCIKPPVGSPMTMRMRSSPVSAGMTWCWNLP
jgi:hypothetical protein